MTSIGFQITHLTLTGTGVADATVGFGSGLNVISGPSDTGKTFIGECINYACGASAKPSEIPEAQRYESVVLGIKALSSGIQYSIQRSFRGGGALVSTSGQPDRILAEKHAPDNDDTISGFLLSLCGLDGRLVRTNSQGTTRQLSFRDLAHLVIVDEEEIIRKHSPVRSRGLFLKTVEDSVFRLLLSGVDDASVIASPAKTIVAAETKGKLELLNLLVGQASASLEEIAPGKSQTELAEQLRRIDANINETLGVVNMEQQGASKLEEGRRAVWRRLTENQSRLAVLSELLERFTLLKAQYVSDLRRLESIAEAGVRLGQMEEMRCLVCGAEAKYHTTVNPDHAVSPSTVANACAAEASRLQLLVSDLDQTIAQNVKNLGKLTEDVTVQRREVQAAERELARYFKPRLNEALKRLQEARNLQASVRRALDLHSRIDNLNTLRAQFDNTALASPASEFVAAAGSSLTEEFALKVEELLRAWQFPGLQRVTFSDADQDLLISGRKRSDHGKGIRAITHAAFTIGLMYYCSDKKMPHPGVVIIDSPMVVYREPDKDEEKFTAAFKDLAYAFLASQQDRGQIIILENEDPPDVLPDSPTIIRFTGGSHGRRGFIPLPAQTEPAKRP